MDIGEAQVGVLADENRRDAKTLRFGYSIDVVVGMAEGEIGGFGQIVLAEGKLGASSRVVEDKRPCLGALATPLSVEVRDLVAADTYEVLGPDLRACDDDATGHDSHRGGKTQSGQKPAMSWPVGRAAGHCACRGGVYWPRGRGGRHRRVPR